MLLPEQVYTTTTVSDYSIYPNGLLNASINYTNNAFTLKYTKHYYAGSQRISSKLGLGANVGQFNCAWLIIPFGSGSAPINEKSTAKEKLDANTTASLAIMSANKITPPVNYGQNAGYNEICVSSYAGNQEKEAYWFHPVHLGSSSFITGIDGEVTQNIEYFPSGEVFVENHKNDNLNSQYKFNGKEQDSETGYYYYGARYYNSRVSLWLNVDPLAEKYPSLSPYIYCANNPVMFIDPDGRDIVLPKGTSTKDTYTILGNLQKLTNDKLVYSTQKDGTIKIKIASLAKSGTETKVTGTRLIRALNSSDNTVTIMINCQVSQGC